MEKEKKSFTKQEKKLFIKRGILIKEKQKLLSWLELYKKYNSLDTYKPENMRHIESQKCFNQLQELDEELKQLETQLNINN